YDLWLRYRLIDDKALLEAYRSGIREVVVHGNSATISAARQELLRGIAGLLGQDVPINEKVSRDHAVLIGTPGSSELVASLGLDDALREIGPEGYLIRTMVVEDRPAIVIAANEAVGALYGVFHFLRLLQTHQPIDQLAIAAAPRVELRL